jgi:hypothetical protein
MNTSILQIAKDHFTALADGKSGDDLAVFFSKNIMQIEYPKRLNPSGGKSDYSTLLERAEKGKKIIVRQEYNIQKEYLVGNTVILEVVWTGIFTVPIGNVQPGQPLKANFAPFMEF